MTEDELKISQSRDHKGGRKFDGDKLQYGLIPPLALRETVKVLTYGAETVSYTHLTLPTNREV